MGKRICIRFGLVAGAATGLFINLLASPACCGTQSLSVAQTVLYGMLVAIIANLFAAAFACLVSRRPGWALRMLALLIALLVGGLLGPLAYAMPHPMVAFIVCAVLGAVIGFLVCWLLCRERFGYAGLKS